MEINTPKQLDITEIAGDFDSKKASINQDSMPFLFEMMSKSLYSNPIGSICREITSNCFDSHIEAGVTKPVIISKKEDESGTYISFKDSGVGLSPDRMSNIYMNYFSSTKRSTNNQIGGFGLGSKTPLSYTDYFYIISIHNNIKYEYLFSKGETVPTLDLLNEEEYDSGNGVEIKIYLKDKDENNRTSELILYNEVDKFEQELKRQLCYFDDVYFVGWEIDNDYKIYETNLYKFRNKDQYSDEMHILLGKVPYPVNWKEIGINPIKACVGVKFDIGELVVTPNREQLRYTEEVKSIVKEKISKVREELVILFTEQNRPITNFREWYSSRLNRPYIRFGDDDKLYLNDFKDVEKKNKFALYEDLEIFYNNPNIFDRLYTCVRYICNSIEDKNPNRISITDIYMNNSSIQKVSVLDTVNTSKIKNDYFRNGYILRRIDTISSNIRNQLIVQTNTKNNQDHNYILGSSNEYHFGSSSYFNLGLAKKIHIINKQLRATFEKICIDYNYVPDDFIEKWKREQRENDNSLQRKLAKKVFVKSISENYEYDWSIYSTIRKRNMEYEKDSEISIEGFRGLVVYGNRDDKYKLEKAARFLSGFKTLKDLDRKVARVILISKQNEKFFNKPNMIHVNELYSDHLIFRKRASCYKIEKFLYNLMRSSTRMNTEKFIQDISNICTTVGNSLNLLLRYNSENNNYYGNGSNLDKELREEIIKIAEENNWFDPVIEGVFSKVEKWFEGVEILKYTDITKDSLPFILKYLRDKGKKLNTEYYLKYTYPVTKEFDKEVIGIGEDKCTQIIMLFPEEVEKKEQVSNFKILTKTA